MLLRLAGARPRLLAWVAAVLFAGAAGATEKLNLNAGGLVLHGYDPVSYHDPDGPRAGSAFHSVDHEGGIYRFVSAVNRGRFLASPETYLPAFGGFCSYGVRVGKKLDVDPEVWRIVDGTLYLQLDRGTQRVWAKDVPKNIAIANRIWPAIRDVPRVQLSD